MRRFSLIFTILLFSIPACGPDDEPKRKLEIESAKPEVSAKPPAVPAPVPFTLKEKPTTPATGTIRGIVKWKGKKVPAKPVIMPGGSFCNDFWKSKKIPLSERWKWGKNDTLQNVVVYVSKGLPSFPKFVPPRQPAELMQEGCMFVPHVLTMQVGQKLYLASPGDAYHSTYVLPRINDEYFLEFPVPGHTETLVFPHAEQGIFIKCNVHAWMSAYVHVLDHPFHAVTGEEGTFEIKDVPPGDYELTAWHEFRRFAPDRNQIKVTVKPGKVSELVITYSPTSN